MSPRSRGFTLVEILVALAIIAVLAAILFPVFNRVRENGRRASCQNNLRQIALAVQQYTQDNNGSLPDIFGGFNPPLGSLPPQVLHCPSAEPLPVPLPTILTLPLPDYVTNHRLQKLVVGLPPMGTEEAKIVRPASTVLAGDGYLFNDDDSFRGFTIGEAQGRGSIRHSGGANYAFCDGHVKWLRPEQVASQCPDKEANSFTFCIQ